MDKKQKTLHLLAAGLLLVATVVAYWPSFSVPFYLDDTVHLVVFDRLHDATDLATIWNTYSSRFVPSWTLAANYHLHGREVFGYHLVNVVVHFLAGLGLWLLLTALLRSPNLDLDRNPALQWLPLIAVAIFLLHPLQTQAVTYIIQRHTSMMAMFYLLSLAAFSWGRVKRDWRLFLLASLAGVLALFSKQNAATLPLAILLVELLFFRKLGPKAVAGVALGAALLAVLVTWMLHWPAFDIQGLTRETPEISRLDYLATQVGVLWHYIGLFFLIGEQRLDFDWPLLNWGWQAQVVVPALAHLALLAIGFALWRRAPLVAFGILFYYLAHAIESSVIPIRDLAFEHRTYLPNAGLSIATGSLLVGIIACRRVLLLRPGIVVLMVFVVTSTYQTWQRNTLWTQPNEFAERETTLSPTSYRVWGNLAMEQFRDQAFNLALTSFEKAYEIAESTQHLDHDNNLLVYHLIAAHMERLHANAIEISEQIEPSRLLSRERSLFHLYLGWSLLIAWSENQPNQDLLATANRHLNILAHLDSENSEGLALLAASEMHLGRPERAQQIANFILTRLDPNNQTAARILRRIKDE